jgi:hypothetical protein
LTDAVKEGATVTSYEESAVDVSLTYADLEGRLSALRAEQTALNGMLEKADSVSAAIEIQSRLSQVRGEIESIESQLRVLDSKISFSTLTLTVFEVEKETVPKKELSFFEEIAAIPHGSGNCSAIASYLVEFAKARSLEYRRDASDNVIIKKPATLLRQKPPCWLSWKPKAIPTLTSTNPARSDKERKNKNEKHDAPRIERKNKKT